MGAVERLKNARAGRVLIAVCLLLFGFEAGRIYPEALAGVPREKRCTCPPPESVFRKLFRPRER